MLSFGAPGTCTAGVNGGSIIHAVVESPITRTTNLDQQPQVDIFRLGFLADRFPLGPVVNVYALGARRREYDGLLKVSHGAFHSTVLLLID